MLPSGGKKLFFPSLLPASLHHSKSEAPTECDHSRWGPDHRVTLHLRARSAFLPHQTCLPDQCLQNGGGGGGKGVAVRARALQDIQCCRNSPILDKFF